MNEKLSFQHVSDALAQKAGVSKKVADIFTKAFFDTVVDAFYMGEESVKVKGLGTFKLVEVESRESVNVSNGERIVIPGYKKVSFAPEDSVVEFLNSEVEAPAEEESPVEEASVAKGTPVVEVPVVEETPVIEAPVSEDIPSVDIPAVEVPVAEESTKSLSETSVVDGGAVTDEVEALVQVPEPLHVEEPQDSFSGIDMLISTPESVEEVRQQYEEAKAKMEAAVEEARKANAEKVRLEKLLARLEANAVPEATEEAKAEHVDDEVQEVSVEEPSAERPSVVEAPVEEEVPAEPVAAEGNKHQEALNRLMNDAPGSEVVNTQPKKSHVVAWTLSIVFVLLAAICFFLYQTFLSIEAVETVPKVEKKEHVKEPGVIHKTQQPNAVKPAASQKQETPKTGEPKSVETKKAEPKPVETKKAEPKDVDKKKEQPKKENVKPTMPTKPTTHVLQRGESLTRVSQKYYGTKDSVRAIIRVNKFNDPDNVPAGAVVKLP